MKYFFFVACIAMQFATITHGHAEPFVQTQATKKPEIKEVTKAEFLKRLTAIHQSVKDETLLVTFIPKEKDPYSIEYDGTNSADIEKGLTRRETGDKVIVESQHKSAIQTTTYILK